MRLLMIHTAGREGSLALADTTLSHPEVASEVLPGRSSSEMLVPAVRRMMTSQHWRLDQLAAIVVVHGPGSFTGVRVGVSAAKGLSEAARVPLIAVSRLTLLAGAMRSEERVHVALDAGRGELYYGEYAGCQRMRESLVSKEDAIAAAAGGVVVVCEASVAEALVQLNPVVIGEPPAADTLTFALKRIAAKDFEDTALLDANYLRRTDAEIFAKPASKV